MTTGSAFGAPRPMRNGQWERLVSWLTAQR